MGKHLKDKRGRPHPADDHRVHREGVEWETHPVFTECHHVGETPSEFRKGVWAGGNPNSDKGKDMKDDLGEDPRKQHPEMQGGQNRTERKPVELIGCGAALGTPARYHLAGTSEQPGRLCVVDEELHVCSHLPSPG